MVDERINPEQDYIFRIAEKLKVTPKILEHTEQTFTCTEKLRLLKEENPSEFSDWKLERVVKALYFSKNGSGLVGVITPELERNISQKELFPPVLNISKTEAAKYWLNPNVVPIGMAWGTCSPFPLRSSVGKEVSQIIFINHDVVKDLDVNISMGGSDKKSYFTSMNIKYGAIYDILREEFGERIHIYS